MKKQLPTNMTDYSQLRNTVDDTEDKKWWVNEIGDLMWRPESPGPEWQPGMEWDDTL